MNSLPSPQTARGGIGLALVLVLGAALSALAWAPTSCWPLALAAYALLFIGLQSATRVAQAGWRGWLFGAALQAAGHSWVFSALHSVVGTSAAFAALCMAVWVAVLALFTALPCAVWQALVRPSQRVPASFWPGALAWAALMALGDWARGLVFNGMTSLTLGPALIDSGLSGLAPVFGAGGLGLVGHALAAMGAVCLLKAHEGRWRSAARGVMLSGLLVFSAAQFTGRLAWTQPIGSPLSVRLARVPAPPQHRFEERAALTLSADYLQRLTASTADIVSTPEMAVPLFLSDWPPDSLARLSEFTRRTGSHLLIGAPVRSAQSQGRNSYLHFHSESSDPQRYDKIRLMPFGEYSPAGFGWITRRLHLAFQDLEAGPSQQALFSIRGQAVGILLCNEAMNSALSRQAVQLGATLLWNPGNFTWFEGSRAPAQQLQIARMRALEVGRPMVRDDGSESALLIDSQGAVRAASLADGASQGLSFKVQGRTRLTPYARWGDLPFLCSAGALVAWAAGARRRQPRHRP